MVTIENQVYSAETHRDQSPGAYCFCVFLEIHLWCLGLYICFYLGFVAVMTSFIAQS